MAIAIVVSVWVHVDLERDIAVAVARSFIQLSAIGLVINAIFEEDRIVFVIALITAMVLFGALTARTGPGTCPAPSGPCCWRSRRRAASHWSWSWRSACSSPNHAFSCPSAEWWSATL